LIVFLAASALAAEEPCYGHQWGNRLEGEHFWVEYADGVITEEQAATVLGAAEHARRVYTDELGFRFTDRAVVIGVEPSSPFTPGGQAQTRECDGEHVPLIFLWTDVFEYEREASVTAHELGHAVEYAYMGQYGDSVASWIWWMEGSAVWFERQAMGEPSTWAWEADAFLAHPEVALHLNAAAFLVPHWSDHMYGSAFLVQYLQDRHGVDGVRATWEYGEPLTGDVIWFPDAIRAQGLDWDEFWRGFLAAATTGDVDGGESLDAGAARIADVEELPASGEPGDLAPQGLGFSVVHFAPGQGTIDVEVDVDPSVPWHVILVTTAGDEPGADVIDWFALEVTDGHAEGSFQVPHGVDGFLVVSPEAAVGTPFQFTWSATGVEARGGACATAPIGSAGWMLGVGLLASRRRARRVAAAEARA
jgi:hypothetical protein